MCIRGCRLVPICIAAYVLIARRLLSCLCAITDLDATHARGNAHEVANNMWPPCMLCLGTSSGKHHITALACPS